MSGLEVGQADPGGDAVAQGVVAVADLWGAGSAGRLGGALAALGGLGASPRGPYGGRPGRARRPRHARGREHGDAAADGTRGALATDWGTDTGGDGDARDLCRGHSPRPGSGADTAQPRSAGGGCRAERLWTPGPFDDGRVDLAPALGDPPRMDGVFIRAPRISRREVSIEVLGSWGDDAVLVRQGRVLAATFHPELTADRRVHELFLQIGEEANG